MLELQDYKAKLFDFAESNGISDYIVSAIFDADISKSSRNWHLPRCLEILEALALLERHEGKPKEDILLLLWRIRNEIRKIPLSFPHLQRPEIRETDLSYKAMAVRLCSYWDGHPSQHKLHRSILSEIQRKRGQRANRQLVKEAASWVQWYRLYCEIYEKKRVQVCRDAHLLVFRRSQISSGPLNEARILFQLSWRRFDRPRSKSACDLEDVLNSFANAGKRDQIVTWQPGVGEVDYEIETHKVIYFGNVA